MITVEKVKPEEIMEVKQLLSFVWSCTYGEYLSADTIKKVTSVWHAPEGLKRQAENPNLYFAVAKNEAGKIIGLVTADGSKKGSLYISRLYIHPDQQRKGVGTKLYESALTHFPDVTRVRLDVEEQNKRAMNFYKKHGFKEIGEKIENVEGEKIKSIKLEKLTK